MEPLRSFQMKRQRIAVLWTKPVWTRYLSLILVPRLQPCSGRLKGKAMIYWLT